MLGLLLGLGAGLVTRIAVAGLVSGVAFGIAGVIYDSFNDYINRKAVQKHFAQKIRETLDSGDYNSISVGLTKEAEIIDVSENEGITYVAYEVDGERYGIRSSEGTSLSQSERFSLEV